MKNKRIAVEEAFVTENIAAEWAKVLAGKDVDPFARRKTTPRLVYDMSLPGTPSENADSGKNSPAIPAAATPTAVTVAETVEAVAAAPAMPQSRMEEIIAFNKDDFEIDIDLDDI